MALDECEHLEYGSVMFPSYEDEYWYWCKKHKIDITPSYYDLVCYECQGQWTEEQILDYVEEH
jgi:hypothetical protein